MPGDSAGALAWRVRESFIRYVAVIARGTIAVDGDAVEREPGVYAFPLRRAVQEGDDWRLSFGGSVRFVAHGGLMDVHVLDPEIVVGSDRGVLATRAGKQGLAAIVALEPAAPVDEGTALAWHAIGTQLAPAAVGLFGDAYPAGTDMGSIEIEVALDS
ncbi:HtaA domain-containing protein [Microbacterium alkaliflavum]